MRIGIGIVGSRASNAAGGAMPEYTVTGMRRSITAAFTSVSTWKVSKHCDTYLLGWVYAIPDAYLDEKLIFPDYCT